MARTARALTALAAIWLGGCGPGFDGKGSRPGGGEVNIQLKDAACFTDGLAKPETTEPAQPASFFMAPADDPWATPLTAELNKRLPQGLTASLVRSERSETGASHYDFRYVAGNVPLCDRLARVHLVGERMFIDNELTGSLPESVSTDGLVWPAPEAVAAAAARQLGVASSAVAVRQSDRCFLLAGGAAEAAWEVHADLAGAPWFVVGTAERLTRVEPRSHPETGEARAFATGPAAGDLATVPLTDLEAGDRLRSSRFTTALDRPVPAAASADHKFDFDPADVRFAEASVFAHAETMAAWLLRPEHHYTMTCVPIALHVHTTFYDIFGNGTVNNAMYTGPEDTPDGLPKIEVGDGDGEELQNLALDFDVVAHELGHHVIFRKLKSRRGESGVIHEGLADYLLFAKTGNPCLGESICPAGSSGCVVEGQCLRTAANSMKLTDADLAPEAHKRSQLISGFLWDLGGKIGHDTAATLVIKGVDYLLPESGYTDLVKSLMAADFELYQGVHACQVYDQAVERGFGEALSGVDCKTYKVVSVPAP